MKKTGLLLVMLATAVWAQTPAEAPAAAPDGAQPTIVSFPTEQVTTPTYSDLYCAGFISKQMLPDSRFVAGGLDTPNTTKYVRGDIVYLQGTGYNLGGQYQVLRALRDLNRYESYPGESALLRQTGQPYAEIARIRVIDTRHKIAIAQVEYSCDSVIPGDTLVPFAEKQTIQYHRPVRFDRFQPVGKELSGRIVMAKDFDTVVGTGQKVYINLGANQGVKVGEYFRATRSYEADLKDPVDSLSFNANMEDDSQMMTPVMEPSILTKASGPVVHVSDLPRRAVGEIVIIGVTPTTATGMIVFAQEDVHAGDDVELDQVQ